jgi:uncharacterized protein (UPF0332 family)
MSFMRKVAFLANLLRERKLELVEPSEEIKESYLAKSGSNLISAKLFFQNGRFEESVYLLYYSMYNMLMALFFRCGIKCENHTASIMLLKDVFGIGNEDITKAKTDRIDAQYYVDSVVTEEEARELITKAEGFSRKLSDFIAKLNI